MVRRDAIVVIAVALSSACSLVTSLDGRSGAADAGAGTGALVDAGRDGEVDAADGSEADAPGTYRDVVLADRPIGYWRLGDTDALGPVIDETGNVAGAFAGAIELGRPGIQPDNPAMGFDGKVSEITIPGARYDFGGNAPFTIEAWIRPTVVDPIYRRIVTNEVGGVRQGWLFWVVDQESGGIGIERYRDNDGDTVTTALAPALGVWSHVVATYDGAILSIWLDGSLRSSAPSERSIAGQSRLRIGGLASGRFSGDLDEVAIYDRALTAPRIAAHHDAGKR
ncbi:MAG: LamG domain-containing protein [Labilithrix sp.]